MKIDRRGLLRWFGGALVAASGDAAAAQPLAVQIHAETGNTRLGALGVRLRARRDPLSPFKPYPDKKRLRLPPIEPTPALSLAEAIRRYAPTPGFTSAALQLHQISRLLYFTNGVTGETQSGGRPLHLRAAPSAGALYAGEVYLVAERVEGLVPGVYYYSVREPKLVLLRKGSFVHEVASALEAPAELADAPAVVLLTNVFRRYRTRYANRGYRFAMIDTGHIGENLRLAARSAGLGEHLALRFDDDRLNGLLEVDGQEETVCAVHAVGHVGPVSLGPMRFLVEKQKAASGQVPKRAGAPDRYHEATKLVPAAVAARPAPAPIRPTPAAESGVVFPAADVPAPAKVEETIQIRRSARRLDAEPLLLPQLGFVLEMAAGHAALERVPGIETQLIVHRVKDVAPGLYRYEPGASQGGTPRLGLVRAGDLRDEMASACLGQEKARAAAVGIVQVARLVESASRGGDRSYRDLLIESGARAQRVYLAAEALGLTARNLAAYLDEEFNALMGLDGRRQAAVHLTILARGV
jgi:SagB-type dehydrogenase family enzyme